MKKLLQVAVKKWRRDSTLPLKVKLQKAREYALSMATTRTYLASVNEFGEGVRTIGKPRIDNQGRMIIGANTILRSVNTSLELCTSLGGELHIGESCSINFGCSIGATQSIMIGNRVRLGPYVFIIDNQFHDLYQRDKAPPSQPVVIEDDVWIGAKATVMPGVRIGRGAVIGAHSLVNKDVPPFTIWGGVPAEQIATLDARKFVTP